MPCSYVCLTSNSKLSFQICVTIALTSYTTHTPQMISKLRKDSAGGVAQKEKRWLE